MVPQEKQDLLICTFAFCGPHFISIVFCSGWLLAVLCHAQFVHLDTHLLVGHSWWSKYILQDSIDRFGCSCQMDRVRDIVVEIEIINAFPYWARLINK